MNMQSSDLHLLAAQHALGLPLRLHRRPISLLLTLAQLAGSLVPLAVAGLLGYTFVSVRSFNPPDVIFGLFALLFGILLLIAGFSGLKYRRFRAWECEAGFLEFDQQGEVKAALRWDHIQTVWHRVNSVSSSRGGTTHFHTYCIQGLSGKEVVLNYPDLWQRIEYEFARLQLPQALATIHAGGGVSFGSVVVWAQGIASGPVTYYLNKARPNPKKPWQLAWQAIPWITVHNGWIEFTPPSGVIVYHAPILARFSDLPNICLLKALVQALTNGHIQWIEKPRRWVHVENSSPLV